LVALMPSLRGAETPATHTQCPMCAEPVRKEALKCKHCGHVFGQTAEAAAQALERAAAYKGGSGYEVGRTLAALIKRKP
jgi:hypothetical protein